MSKTVVLPDQEEMLNRLLKVNDDLTVTTRFYPLLLKSAGLEYNATDIVFILTTAIYEYTANLHLLVLIYMYSLSPKIVEVLVEDEEVKQEAQDLLKRFLVVKK